MQFRHPHPCLAIECLFAVLVVLLPGGCPADSSGTDTVLVPVVAGTTATGPAAVTDAPTAPIPVTSSATSRRVGGTVGPLGDYLLFDVGPARRGEHWTVQAPTGGSLAFLVVLLDDQYELLYREIVAPGTPLRHIARFD